MNASTIRGMGIWGPYDSEAPGEVVGIPNTVLKRMQKEETPSGLEQLLMAMWVTLLVLPTAVRTPNSPGLWQGAGRTSHTAIIVSIPSHESTLPLCPGQRP